MLFQTKTLPLLSSQDSLSTSSSFSSFPSVASGRSPSRSRSLSRSKRFNSSCSCRSPSECFLAGPSKLPSWLWLASQIASLLHVQTHHSSRSMMPPLSSFNFFEGSATSLQIRNQDPNDGREKDYSDAHRLVWNTNTSTANGFPASCYHHLHLAGQPMQPSLFPPKIKFNRISGLV